MRHSKGYVLSKIKRLVRSIDQRAMVQLYDPPGLMTSQQHQSWDILIITDRQATATKRQEIQEGLSFLAKEMNQHIDSKFTDLREWKQNSKGAHLHERTRAEAIIL